ncbi:YlxR family protein [Tuanshanicoccus lijuaniae]|uniref:RNase P modulator RnpM n=1 Tax=Aerococcaceae bacterium zg-1292 TaxID=2774330 RepID=UPI00193715F7|nr:YlxR family protein [Aerococcaceae bacterium zg-1292]MBF6626530.1 YlxR family protein [Aerococcaceae bacterium zg-BR9]MBF6977939.1 YlxR family protein [Aerococcaceae bacterium zg-BR22]MBS4455860.1 YlxR family protein [Aerococcaceae bacterium zg-A91]MBS4457602.1 YlxR family protein [Aerococcaceae bacterium zg-BR33]
MKQQPKRKIPLRKCIVSGEMFPKKELVRVVKTKEGEVSIDPTGRQNGRGAYIGLEPELALLAKKKRTFDSAFGIKISDAFYDELYRYIDYQKARKEIL